jgi:hypothetical protein
MLDGFFYHQGFRFKTDPGACGRGHYGLISYGKPDYNLVLCQIAQ